jgi:signal transduction histidine kinase
MSHFTYIGSSPDWRLQNQSERIPTRNKVDGIRSNSQPMRFFRRSLIALGVAASLPTIIFVAVGTFIFLRAESQRVENETLGRVQMITTLADARLRGHVAALTVLTGSIYMETRDWAEFYPRVQRLQITNPQWATVVLYDVSTLQVIFDLRQPLGTPGLPSLDPAIVQVLQARPQPFVGDMYRESEPLVHIYAPVIVDGVLRYVISAGIRPTEFQELIQPQGRTDAVAALVDRRGVFVARSLDAEHRIGRPATEFVRNAISTKPQGMYRGRTYEGLRNYTAYYVSPWSGWSTHIAIASTLIDSPISWSFVVATGAALGGLLLGIALIVLVLRDMAERRLAEETLRQSQKMEAVGQLTGGIAHDFNNLLTAVIGNLDLIRTRAVGNERLLRLASNALEAARRGAKLASQLLAFSRNQRLQVAPVALRQLLNGMGDLLAQSVGPAVRIKTHIDSEVDAVLSDANQLELALLNLAVNARDAMPNGGTFAIDVRPAAYRDVRQLPKRAYVEIAVKDSGSGMPENVRTRAMEPFFTTKPVGQGTGLGLSQVYGIVRESGGLVLVDSAPDQGTTVRMILPGAPPTSAAMGPDSAASPTIPSPSSNLTTTVLVVDDDHQVRRFIAEALRSQGFAVSDVPTVEAGLHALRTGRVDLLVADFAMPGMNGADLAREAWRLQPAIRVLIVSGYANSTALDEVLDEAHLLRKPFAVAELSAAVSRVLAPRSLDVS